MNSSCNAVVTLILKITTGFDNIINLALSLHACIHAYLMHAWIHIIILLHQNSESCHPGVLYIILYIATTVYTVNSFLANYSYSLNYIICKSVQWRLYNRIWGICMGNCPPPPTNCYNKVAIHYIKVIATDRCNKGK